MMSDLSQDKSLCQLMPYCVPHVGSTSFQFPCFAAMKMLPLDIKGRDRKPLESQGKG